MSEGFHSPPSPPATPDEPSMRPESARARQEVTDTVRRIMGEDIAPVDPPGPGGPSDRTPPTHLRSDDSTSDSTSTSGSTSRTSTDSSTTQVAKDQAIEVADTAKQAGAQVAGTVQEQAANVTAEAGRQAKHLLYQARSELTEQAASTQQRVSEGLHALADELSAMVTHSDQDGPATDLARQAADRAHQAAGWLADRDPGSLLDEVRSFGRRKPGTYLAIALGAGVLAGRLARGLTAPDDDSTATGAAGHPAATAPPPAQLSGTTGPRPLGRNSADDVPGGAGPTGFAGIIPETGGSVGAPGASAGRVAP